MGNEMNVIKANPDGEGQVHGDPDFSAELALLRKPHKSKNIRKRLNYAKISRDQKFIARAQLRQRIFQEIHCCYDRLKERVPNFSYKALAERLQIDPALVSRRMNGQANMTIETIADLFLALEVSPEIFGVPIGEARPSGYSQLTYEDVTVLEKPKVAPTAWISVTSNVVLSASPAATFAELTNDIPQLALRVL